MSIAKYKIQQKISTLAENFVGVGTGNTPQFTVDGITFYQWEFNFAQGALGGAWLAEATVEADNFKTASAIFRQKISRIVPITTFVSQCYMKATGQPYLIHKEGSKLAYFYDIYAEEETGLQFEESELQAVLELYDNEKVPVEFYYYWADATNTAGYSARLVLMCAAVENLIGKKNGHRNREKTVEILGQELADKLFKGSDGLRNRLAHGEYLRQSDTEVDVTELIHYKIIEYFNNLLLRKKLLSTDVIGPQRHPDNNLYASGNFIEAKNDKPLNLKAVLDDVANSSDRFCLQNYRHCYDDSHLNY